MKWMRSIHECIVYYVCENTEIWQLRCHELSLIVFSFFYIAHMRDEMDAKHP